MSMERIKELQKANDVLQNELCDLREELSLAKQKVKTVSRRCNDTEHAAQVKALLASCFGGKCARIQEVDGRLHDVASAAIAHARS